MGNYSASELFFYGLIITVVAVIVLNPANWVWLGMWIVGPARREKFLRALRKSIESEPDPQSRFVQLWVLNSALMGSKYDTAPRKDVLFSGVVDVMQILDADDQQPNTFFMSLPACEWRELLLAAENEALPPNEFVSYLLKYYERAKPIVEMYERKQKESWID